MPMRVRRQASLPQKVPKISRGPPLTKASLPFPNVVRSSLLHFSGQGLPSGRTLELTKVCNSGEFSEILPIVSILIVSVVIYHFPLLNFLLWDGIDTSSSRCPCVSEGKRLCLNRFPKFREGRT